MKDRNSLEEAYKNTVLTLNISGLDVEITDSNFSGHVITAFNPYSEIRSETENEAANNQLLRILVEQNCLFIEATGKSEDGHWVEKGFAIQGLSDVAAVEIARNFGQNAIFKITNGVKLVVWCD